MTCVAATRYKEGPLRRQLERRLKVSLGHNVKPRPLPGRKHSKTTSSVFSAYAIAQNVLPTAVVSASRALETLELPHIPVLSDIPVGVSARLFTHTLTSIPPLKLNVRQEESNDDI